MTGREGETFPGFFMAEAGQPDTDEREVRSSQEEGDGLGMLSLGVRRHLWLEEVAVRGPTAVLWRCIGRRAERQGGGCIARGPFRHCL